MHEQQKYCFQDLRARFCNVSTPWNVAYYLPLLRQSHSGSPFSLSSLAFASVIIDILSQQSPDTLGYELELPTLILIIRKMHELTESDRRELRIFT